MLSEKRNSFRPQPKQTIKYQVQSGDTLESLAAKSNITPSELINLNKLISRTVFPGQIIYVPETSSLNLLENKQECTENQAIEQIKISSITVDNIEETIAIAQNEGFFNGNTKKDIKSLCINSKHVTDGEGVVSGDLLVTPNVIMFDPNVSDPLVIEYGVEKYGVVAPLNFVVRAALYPDILRMYSNNSEHYRGKEMNLYHSNQPILKKSYSQEVKREKNGIDDKNFLHSSNLELNSQNSISSERKVDSQENFSKICDQVNLEIEKPNEILSDSICDSKSDSKFDSKNSLMENVYDKYPSLQNPDNDYAIQYNKTSSTSNLNSYTSEKRSSFVKTKDMLHKSLKKLSLSDIISSNPLSTRRISLPILTSSLSATELKTNNLLTLTESKTEATELNTYVNLVEEKNEVFNSYEKLIPRPAKSYDDNPLYFCLRMGYPTQKPFRYSTPVINFGTALKPEYWFSIPKNSVERLYKFLLRWCPEKYGDIDDINLEEMGFKPISANNEPRPLEDMPSSNQQSSWNFIWRRKSKETSAPTYVSSPEDWEFVDSSDLRKQYEAILPELLTPSSILTEEQILQICKYLPARAISSSWTLIYSTEIHGFSLKTLYREMTNYETPILLVISSRIHAVFGALLSCPLKISDHFYGTGETFLFTFTPEFKVFHWSGENNYFIKGNTDSFVIGASEGHFGLWLDDDLFHGRTKSCRTFCNAPLCTEEDFVVKALEAWGFL